MGKVRKFLISLLILVLLILSLGGVAVMSLSGEVMASEKDNIVYAVTDEESIPAETAEALKEQKPECIMVLGCGISDKETPTPMLRDRLETAIMLYRAGVAPKVLLTGDNGTLTHNEIHVMLKYMRDAGIPEEDIFCDHAGFSTYESMYRAVDIFCVRRMIVVTQTYHMYRSLYIAHGLGIEAVGVASDQKVYAGQAQREIREVLARVKDFFQSKSKPPATFGGEEIPITGSGVSSHGE